MIPNLIQSQYCYDVLVTDVSLNLLFYSHIPGAIIALLFAFYVYSKNRVSPAAKFLLALAVSFFAWSTLDLLSWFAFLGRETVMTSWSVLEIFDVLFYVFAFGFIYSFNARKFPSFKILSALSIIPLSVIAIVALGYDLSGGYDAINCEAIESVAFVNYLVGSEFVITLAILGFSVWNYIKVKDSVSRVRQVLSTIGILLFLYSFTITSWIASQTEDYAISVYGVFGMPVFLIFVGYLVVKYQAFNLKVFTAQALIVALIALIGSQFAFLDNTVVIALNTLTFILVFGLGVRLIKNVKAEIEAKERIAKLASDLEQANTQQESLIRFISHEMKGYLTTSAGMFASIVEGDFNPITPALKSASETSLARVREGVNAVVEILSNTNAKKGTLKYDMQSFDLRAVVRDAIERFTPEAKGKGLVLESDIHDEAHMIYGDKSQISEHVIRNLIDNAIKYTPAGAIKVSLSKTDGKVIFSVKDSGVGLTENDKKKLFTEGGRGENSLKINVHSTGYGLAIAKRITEAHKGRIWAESEGEGKGSKFIIEIPEVK